MSRDFAPCHHWYSYLRFPEIYTSNIRMSFDGKEWDMFSEEELEDRKRHITTHVLASDVYKEIRELLSADDFDRLDETLRKLVDADVNGGDFSSFPVEMLDWYFNKNGHYHHQPNDEEFLAYLKKVRRFPALAAVERV